MLTGARTNSTKLDIPGIIVSFIINFRASAIGCKYPKIPTTLGPLLLCTDAKIFLSNNVNKATSSKIGKNGGKTFKISTSKTTLKKNPPKKVKKIINKYKYKILKNFLISLLLLLFI